MSYPLFLYELRYVHSPVVPGLTKTPPLVKFELGWLLREGFFELVSEIWNKETKGSTSLQVWQKQNKKSTTISERMG
jgi:hypothetical protein